MDVKALEAVVAQATQAPSIHNTQPWRFRLRRDRIEVWADRTRAVPVIDPSGRQLHISCGAAVEYAHLAVLAAGHECALTLLPDGERPDLLAVLETGAAREPTGAERALVAALPGRHTHRDPFDARPVPAEVVQALRREVADAGAWLHVLRRTEDLIVAAVLLSHAEEAELADPAYVAELSRWVGVELTTGEGVPLRALPEAPAGRRAASLRVREFRPGAPEPGGQGPAGSSAPPPVEHPLIVILGTAADDRRAWLLAGRALARLLLRAAADGLSASPLNQVLDQPGFRARFARELGLVGYPQMVLRMGYAHPQAGAARRPVVEVLE